MKKYIITLLLGLIGATAAWAQTVTFDPAEFTAEDQVTMTVDFTGTALDDASYGGNIFIWFFITEGCSSNCDAPTNVNPGGEGQEAARLQPTDQANIYTLTFVPTSFFNKTPGELLQLGFKFKGTDWSDGEAPAGFGQNLFVDVVPLEFIPVPLRAFPATFTQDDVVTFFFDQNHPDVNATLKNLDEIYMYTDINLKDGTFVQLVGWESVGETAAQMFTDEGNGIFTLSMVPADFYQLTEGQEIDRMKIHIRSGPMPNFDGPEPPASLGDRFFSPIKADAVTGDF